MLLADLFIDFCFYDVVVCFIDPGHSVTRSTTNAVQRLHRIDAFACVSNNSLSCPSLVEVRAPFPPDLLCVTVVVLLLLELFVLYPLGLA